MQTYRGPLQGDFRRLQPLPQFGLPLLDPLQFRRAGPSFPLLQGVVSGFPIHAGLLLPCFGHGPPRLRYVSLAASPFRMVHVPFGAEKLGFRLRCLFSGLGQFFVAGMFHHLPLVLQAGEFLPQ